MIGGSQKCSASKRSNAIWCEKRMQRCETTRRSAKQCETLRNSARRCETMRIDTK